ncbi:helix-turn-helix transcriptional regulator [Bradyrhizobium sp. CCBAU 53338]|uniref:helix-turn-helix domain-containing protein n=1 Tax=Bradyrhizobium sp. CCBAU 53338 TaxID=1325111 RepID=UPI00188B9E18|nr:helix-turn-helix transcriptional regulator [Bradyrhizobium sp. CCBAU 53338]QOZ51477.1 transcriptional regulator [Bradyrhizobium sp. CCBAU 53338]
MLVISRQIKAARVLAGWEQYELAVKTGLGISTIRRLEALEGKICAHFDTVERIRRAFAEAGVSFLGYPCPGVKLDCVDKTQENA